MSFENAPVSKGIMMGCALTSIAAGLFDVKHYLHLQFVPHISRHHQYWRLFLHNFAFSSSSDLFVAELVLYNVAIQIERQFGSVKFASFAVVSTLLSTIIEFISLIMLHRIGLNYIPGGPSTLVCNILYQYYRIVPSVYDFRIFGVPLSNKSFVYILAFQLAISRLPGSAATALIGILAGQIYRSDFTNIKSYRLPPALVRFSVRFLLPLVGSTRPTRQTNRALPDDPSMLPSAANGGEGDDVAMGGRASAPSPGTPSSSSIDPPGPDLPTDGDSRAEEAEGSLSRRSVVREWVNELTGRASRSHAGIRVPTEAEIATLVNIFPDTQREVVVAALQQSPTPEAAVEMLLNS